MKKKLIFFLFWGMCYVAFAQNGSADKEPNYGMKMGIGVHSFHGAELKNPTPTMGYVAGLYIHDNLSKGKMHFQAGLDIRFRGSNFDNANTGDTAVNTAYTKIGLVTLDMPFAILYSLAPSKKEKAPFLTAGFVVGYIMRSTVYIGPDKIPLNRSVYTQTWDNLPLKPIEVQASIGFQQKFADVGIQLNLTYGLSNLNNNFRIENIAPTTGTGKSIGTWGLEGAIIF
jgi:hypothetical protein